MSKHKKLYTGAKLGAKLATRNENDQVGAIKFKRVKKSDSRNKKHHLCLKGSAHNLVSFNG